MSRFISDQNRLGFFYESGLYATPTGTTLQWIGQVQSHDIDESMNVSNIRYVGGGDRNVDAFVNGPEDYTGTITYYPQDWKLLVFAMGSIYSEGSPSPYTHHITEISSASGNAFTSGTKNPFMSFTTYDSHKTIDAWNLNRQLQGCTMNSYSINISQGEIVSCEGNYVAQHLIKSSGAQTAVTAATTRPFLWQDVRIHIPSGTVIDNVKEATWTINNNLEPPHYLNGSRVIDSPIPLNRDYEFSITMDSERTRIGSFYDVYFRGGSTFNAMIEIIDASTEFGAGSRDLFIMMSGCKLIDMENPTANEGADEQTLTIIPQTCNADVNDTIAHYNPWVDPAA